jgi:hypothetical protein
VSTCRRPLLALSSSAFEPTLGGKDQRLRPAFPPALAGKDRRPPSVVAPALAGEDQRPPPVFVATPCVSVLEPTLGGAEQALPRPRNAAIITSPAES